jgi:hypothetical protein
VVTIGVLDNEVRREAVALTLLTFAVCLVGTTRLVSSRVNTRRTKGGIIVEIDQAAGVDPAVLLPLQREGGQAITDLIPHLIEGDTPVIRYHLERDIPGGRLVHVEVDPLQTDVYLMPGLIPWDITREISAQSNHLLRHFSL